MCRACGSRPVVGSSSSSTSGWLISARAIVSRRFIPPESGSTRESRRSRELHELEQLLGPAPDLGAGQVEVAPVDHEVVPDRELGVEVVLLRHDAEPAADLRAVGRGIHPEDAQRAARYRRHAADHPHGRALAGAVGAEETEGLAGIDHEVDAVDRDERAEPLRERVGVDERIRHGCRR